MAEEYKPTEATHERLWEICQKLPTDFEPYGKRVRDSSDCSCACKYYHRLEEDRGQDWGVCFNPRSPRSGLLTFEHQGCPEFEGEE